MLFVLYYRGKTKGSFVHFHTHHWGRSCSSRYLRTWWITLVVFSSLIVYEKRSKSPARDIYLFWGMRTWCVIESQRVRFGALFVKCIIRSSSCPFVWHGFCYRRSDPAQNCNIILRTSSNKRLWECARRRHFNIYTLKWYYDQILCII